MGKIELFAPRRERAEDMIRRCREVIADYLPPDSGISRDEALDRIIGILDEPDGEQFVKAGPEVTNG
jgi:hypothetical protein